MVYELKHHSYRHDHHKKVLHWHRGNLLAKDNWLVNFALVFSCIMVVFLFREVVDH